MIDIGKCRDRACPCPNRKNPRLKGFDYSELRSYFITICTKEKKSYFVNDKFNINIIDCLNQEEKRTNSVIYVYCLMPNHLHFVISPPGNGFSVSQFVGGFKSKATRIGWKYGIDGRLWQARFYDHIIRRRRDIRKIGEYILTNPVKEELVENWRDYKYSGWVGDW